MALLNNLKQSFVTYVSPLKPSTTERLLTPPISEHSPEFDFTAASKQAGTSKFDANLKGDTLVALATKSRKHSLKSKASQGVARKKHKTADETFFPEDESGSEFEGTILETSTQKGADDYGYMGDQTEDLSDEETFTNSTAIRKNEPKEVVDFDEQKALRYAEAITLPETGGTWAEAEKDLFHRLAFRGFEPLIPANWVNDFKTLPSSLFSVAGGDPPLIQSHLQRDFRGIHALRRLFSMGMIIRDRALSKRNLRPEPILRRNVGHYISWALADVGIHPRQRPNAIPVHTLVTMRRGETTQATLTTISEKLHKLADRVRESIEPRDSVSVSSEGTNSEDLHLPILTGLMICSSLIAVVTLNPATHVRTTSNLQRSLQATKDESGVRLIATFDFSEDGMDVWNALAIAICVMRIRKTMLELCERGEANGENEKGGLWERGMIEGSPVTTEDPDVHDKTVVRGLTRQASCTGPPMTDLLNMVTQQTEQRPSDKVHSNELQKSGSDVQLENTPKGPRHQAKHPTNRKRPLWRTENAPGISSNSMEITGDYFVASPDSMTNDSVSVVLEEETNGCRESSVTSVQPALELFTIRRNGCKNYSIERKTTQIPKWTKLRKVTATSHAGVIYTVGDPVYILLQGQQDAIAKIRHIRELPDGRNLICVSWYYSQDEAIQWSCTNMTEWPAGCSHLISTQLQVLMWDTANGRVPEEQLGRIVDEKVLHFYERTVKICDKSETVVRWLSTAV